MVYVDARKYEQKRRTQRLYVLILYLYVTARFNFGKNSFLTGFGLGFLAFGLKKLLLPIIIGVQIVKSVALAALLPTLLGTVGKVVSKGMQIGIIIINIIFLFKNKNKQYLC